MTALQCEWDNLFKHEDLTTLQEGLVFTDSASVVLGLWLNSALLLTDLKYDLGYRNLAFFTIITCLRRALPLSNYLLLSESWFSITDSCTFNGFWNTFMSVYEVECLTHVCIERYVVAKYINNGWSLIRWHYTMYQGLCLLFAGLYSTPPIFGFGSYGLDFTCTSCTFAMTLPESWHRYLAVLIYLLRSLKSGTFMFVMLYWASKLQAKNKDSKKMMEEALFTKSVVAITAVNVACWMPITLLRGRVVLTQFLYGLTVVPTVFQVQWAMWLSAISPALTSAALLLLDDRIRSKTVNSCIMAEVRGRKKNM